MDDASGLMTFDPSLCNKIEQSAFRICPDPREGEAGMKRARVLVQNIINRPSIFNLSFKLLNQRISR